MATTVRPPRTPALPGAAGFIGYLLASAMISFGLLAVFTPFVLFALLGLALATVLLVRRHTGADLFGLISGLSAVPLWLAWSNRGGPTYDCARGSGDNCPDLSSPWPWVAAGVALLAAGIAAYAFARRRPHDSPG
jgi:hypothetical protein